MTGRNRRIAAAVGLVLMLALTALVAPAGAEAAKKGKKRGSNKAKVFRSNAPAAIPDRGLGAGGSFGVLDSWIRVGRAMKGKEVADVDVGFSITGPPNQLADI